MTRLPEYPQSLETFMDKMHISIPEYSYQNDIYPEFSCITQTIIMYNYQI